MLLYRVVGTHHTLSAGTGYDLIGGPERRTEGPIFTIARSCFTCLLSPQKLRPHISFARDFTTRKRNPLSVKSVLFPIHGREQIRQPRPIHTKNYRTPAKLFFSAYMYRAKLFVQEGTDGRWV